MNTGARAIATEWLGELQRSVRTGDVARWRAIFAKDVVGFDAQIGAAIGLDAVERDQWRRIWARVRDLTLLTDALHGALAGQLLWLACPWTSESRDRDGDWQRRPGGITAVLERRDQRWLAVHFHSTFTPDRAAQPRPVSEASVRPAHAGESESLGALTVRSKQHWGYDAAFMAAAREDLAVTEADVENDSIFVLEHHGRTVGHVHLRAKDERVMRLESLFLEPDVIGLGYGRRLFEFAAHQGRDRGFSTMEFESDPNAESFYLAMGAVRRSLVESSVRRGRMLPFMTFDLTSSANRPSRPSASE